MNRLESKGSESYNFNSIMKGLIVYHTFLIVYNQLMVLNELIFIAEYKSLHVAHQTCDYYAPQVCLRVGKYFFWKDLSLCHDSNSSISWLCTFMVVSDKFFSFMIQVVFSVRTSVGGIFYSLGRILRTLLPFPSIKYINSWNSEPRGRMN